jgi:Protein of unknown function (DUF3109).
MSSNFEREIKGLKIDPIIFTQKFKCKCVGECCNYGVYTDLKEYEMIMGIKDKIIPLLDESQTADISKWFEAPEDDDDFESGVAVGTELHNSKCVFLDKNGLCTLQKLALNEGAHKWKYKPIYCILYPLTIYEGALTIDDDHMNRLKTCNKEPNENLTIFDSCKEEIVRLLGEEGLAELEKYKEEYLKNNRNN